MESSPARARLAAAAAALSFSLAPALAADAAGQPPQLAPADPIPARPADAPTGTQFARKTAGLGGRQRQARAVEELSRGNLPDFLRGFKPVRLRGADGGDGPVATIWVTPDYLAIGSDEDFLRIPLTYPSAVTVASRFGCVLPTRKMVDAIYEQADHRLTPSTMTPGPSMRSTAYYLEHQAIVQRQLAGRPRGELIAGHKKDVVITNRLSGKPGRIAIYGWHRSRRQPIQPLSTVHGSRYADYSHGLRLVRATCTIDGEAIPVVEALEDPELAPLLSYEGVIANVRSLLSPRQVSAASP